MRKSEGKNTQEDKRSGDVLSRSLVKRGVDGNLKVVAVNVGGLVQHRQYILNEREKEIYYK